VAKVGTSNQDRTISPKAAMRSCINKTDDFNLKEFVLGVLQTKNVALLMGFGLLLPILYVLGRPRYKRRTILLKCSGLLGW
jgi:hypothetical protein